MKPIKQFGIVYNSQIDRAVKLGQEIQAFILKNNLLFPEESVTLNLKPSPAVEPEVLSNILPSLFSPPPKGYIQAEIVKAVSLKTELSVKVSI